MGEVQLPNPKRSPTHSERNRNDRRVGIAGETFEIAGFHKNLGVGSREWDVETAADINGAGTIDDSA
jgi:hypothetical protein